MNEKEAGKMICNIGRRMYQRNFVAANDGNISARIGDDLVLCTPTGVSKGDLIEDMLVTINMNGDQIAGKLKASSEMKMHLRIYKENPEVRAVAHAHPPVSTAFAVAGIRLDKPILPEAVIFLGDVPVAPYATTGTDGVGDSLAPYCKTHYAALLANHGAVTWGRNLTEAFFRMEALEHYATILMYTDYIIGKSNELNEDQLDALERVKEKFGFPSSGKKKDKADFVLDFAKGESIENIGTVTLDDENSAMVILDQTLLPVEEKHISLSKIEDIWEAIYKLRVRGAPAIGVAAAHGIYLAAKGIKAKDYSGFIAEFAKAKDYLASSRPTAVNLFWALDRMEKVVLEMEGESPSAIKKALLEEALEIEREDKEVCRKIGENALTLLKPGMGLLTHCNAGALATAGYGTALAPIHMGQEQGYNFKVYADETRPLLQGARLTTWELMKSGVDVTLICDNMAAMVMKKGEIQAVLVGCDRVAANGDAANKIGTSGVAILAKEYGIPFYVLGPLSTIDMEAENGGDIVIEERPGEEIYKLWYERPMAPAGVKTFNPAFDVTDAKYITAIITEKGIVNPPFKEGLAELFK